MHFNLEKILVCINTFSLSGQNTVNCTIPHELLSLFMFSQEFILRWFAAFAYYVVDSRICNDHTCYYLKSYVFCSLHYFSCISFGYEVRGSKFKYIGRAYSFLNLTSLFWSASHVLRVNELDKQAILVRSILTECLIFVQNEAKLDKLLYLPFSPFFFASADRDFLAWFSSLYQYRLFLLGF